MGIWNVDQPHTNRREMWLTHILRKKKKQCSCFELNVQPGDHLTVQHTESQQDTDMILNEASEVWKQAAITDQREFLERKIPNEMNILE